MSAVEDIIQQLEAEVKGLDFQALNNLSVISEERIGKFTASEAHRLMTGADLSPDERAMARFTVPELKAIAKEAEVKIPSNAKKEDVFKAVKQYIRQEYFADFLPDGAMTYVEEKIIEQKTGKPIMTFESFDMRRGKELEEPTVFEFQKRTGMTVRKWGGNQVFVQETDIPELAGHIGCTPDGEVWADMERSLYGFEGKAPRETTHFRYLYGSLDGKQQPLTASNLKDIEPTYYWQIIHGLMMKPDYKGWFFCSFHPDFKDEERLLFFTIQRADVLQDIQRLSDRLKLAVKKKVEILSLPKAS